MSSAKNKRSKRVQRQRRRSGAPSSSPIQQPNDLHDLHEPSVEPSLLEAASDSAPPSVEREGASAETVAEPETRRDPVSAAKQEAMKASVEASPALSTNIDTGSVAPVSRDAPEMDFDAEDDVAAHSDFFTKSTEEVHQEEARREAPDLHESDLVAHAYRAKKVDRRARSIVIGVLTVCGLIGATAIMRKAVSAAPRAPMKTEIAAAAQLPEAPQPQAVIAPVETTAQPAPVVTAPVTDSTEKQADPAPPSAETTPAPTTVAVAETTAAPLTPPTVAPIETTPKPTTTTTQPAATTTTAAAVDDKEAAMSGAQLLAAARAAMNSNNAARAATLARKALSKGAGGSAYYVLGAAYQMMGAKQGAKSAYGSCAKSGAPEAGECTALAENL